MFRFIPPTIITSVADKEWQRRQSEEKNNLGEEQLFKEEINTELNRGC